MEKGCAVQIQIQTTKNQNNTIDEFQNLANNLVDHFQKVKDGDPLVLQLEEDIFLSHSEDKLNSNSPTAQAQFVFDRPQFNNSELGKEIERRVCDVRPGKLREEVFDV